MMWRISLVGLMLITSCSYSDVGNGKPLGGVGYFAIDPIPLPKFSVGGSNTETAIELLRDSGLTSVGSVTSTFQVDSALSLDGGGVAKASSSSSEYRMYQDILVYKVVPYLFEADIEGEAEKSIYSLGLVVGVGARVTAILNSATAKASGSAPSILAVTGSVNSKSVYASISTVGVLSPTIVALPKFAGALTQENLATYFQNLAVIHSEMTKPDTLLTPHILGFYFTRVPTTRERSTMFGVLNRAAIAAGSLESFEKEMQRIAAGDNLKGKNFAATTTPIQTIGLDGQPVKFDERYPATWWQMAGVLPASVELPEDYDGPLSIGLTEHGGLTIPVKRTQSGGFVVDWERMRAQHASSNSKSATDVTPPSKADAEASDNKQPAKGKDPGNGP